MRAQNPSRNVQRLSDLAELLQIPPGRALLDGANLPAEDLGIIRRTLQAGGRVITILGGDPSTGTLRALLKHPCTSWLPYPPDSEELSQLITAPPAQAAPKQPQSSYAAEKHDPPAPENNEVPENHPKSKQAAAHESTPPMDPNLAEIEAILRQPASTFQSGGLGDSVTAESPQNSSQEAGRLEVKEVRPQSEARPDPRQEDRNANIATETQPHVAPRENHSQEPPWFKDQIADLADIVQAVYSSTSVMAEDGASAPPGLMTDSMRLVQFTRTLGFLAAPPARGATQFDLGELAEDLLRSAGAAPEAPRFLLKIAQPLMVRGDKELIVQALDAILVLARLCSGPEGEVRLSGHKDSGGGTELRLGFSRGPLGEMTPEDIVTPYALRSALPDMGKNALRAATRIIEGQGGTMALSDPGGGLLSFQLTLPSP